MIGTTETQPQTMGVLKDLHIEVSEQLTSILENFDLTAEDASVISRLTEEHEEGEDIHEGLSALCNDPTTLPEGAIALLRNVLQIFASLE